MDARVQPARLGEGCQHRRRLGAECCDDVVREHAQLHAVLVHQCPERRRVHPLGLGQRERILRPTGLGDDRLQVRGQALEELPVYHALTRAVRLVQARAVIVRGGLVEAEGEVARRAGELGRVHRPALQGRQGLARRQRHLDDAHGGIEHAAEPRHAKAQALEVGNRMQLLAEPAAHRHAGIARHERLRAEPGIELVPERLAAAMLDPGHVLEGGQAEGHGEEELGDRHLAGPEDRRRVAELGHPLAHRVQHLEGRHELTGGMELDLDGTAAHGLDALAEPTCGDPRPRQVLRPGGHHAPALGRLAPRHGRGCDRGGTGEKRRAPGRHHGFLPSFGHASKKWCTGPWP